MPSEEFGGACTGQVDGEGEEGLKEEGGLPGCVENREVIFAMFLAVLRSQGNDGADVCDLKEVGKEGGREG